MNPLSVIVRIKTKTSRLCKRIPPALQSVPPPTFLSQLLCHLFSIFSSLLRIIWAKGKLLPN